jgi:uncharacterized membrane protein YesL
VITLGSAFKIFWQSVRDLFDEMFLLFGANLLFVVLNAPFFGMAWILLVNQAVIPAAALALIGSFVLGPTNAGLYSIAERVADGRATKIGQFFAGFREHLRLSWSVYVPWMFGLVLILVNLQFYAQLGGGLGAVLLVLFLYLLAIWFAASIYIGPLMFLQTDKRLRVIARNAAIMVFGRPIFTGLTLILMGLLFFVSAWLVILLLLITFSFFALWGFRATLALIKDDEARRLAREAAQDEQKPNFSDEKGRGGQVRPKE